MSCGDSSPLEKSAAEQDIEMAGDFWVGGEHDFGAVFNDCTRENADRERRRTEGQPASDLNCSEYEAGFRFAGDQTIDNPNACAGKSPSFMEGCLEYVRGNEEYMRANERAKGK